MAPDGSRCRRMPQPLTNREIVRLCCSQPVAVQNPTATGSVSTTIAWRRTAPTVERRVMRMGQQSNRQALPSMGRRDDQPVDRDPGHASHAAIAGSDDVRPVLCHHQGFRVLRHERFERLGVIGVGGFGIRLDPEREQRIGCLRAVRAEWLRSLRHTTKVETVSQRSRCARAHLQECPLFRLITMGRGARRGGAPLLAECRPTAGPGRARLVSRPRWSRRPHVPSGPGSARRHPRGGGHELRQVCQGHHPIGWQRHSSRTLPLDDLG